MTYWRRFLLSFLFILTALILVNAQDDAGYKMPPKDIADMLLAKPTPGVTVDDKGEWMAFTETSLYPSVEELARPELKIAGLRNKPAKYAPTRKNLTKKITLHQN